MPWPDIFFKAKAKKSPEPELPPPFPTPLSTKPEEPQPPPIRPVPPEAATKPAATPPPLGKAPTPPERSTRTIPAVHGVVLRPPMRTATGRLVSPTAPAEPLKNIEQLMTEADPVKTLSQTGSVRLLKRLTAEAPPLKAPGVPVLPPPKPEAGSTAPAGNPVIIPPRAVATASPWPSFQPKGASIEVRKSEPPAVEIRKAAPIPPIEVRKVEPSQVVAVTPPVQHAPSPRPVEKDSTFMSKTSVSLASASRPPSGPPPMLPIGPITKRKAKLADVARLVLPPKREETGPLLGVPGPSATVVPPSFPVASATPRPLPRPPTRLLLPSPAPAAATESPFLDRAKPAISSAAPAAQTPPAVAPSEEPSVRPPSTRPESSGSATPFPVDTAAHPAAKQETPVVDGEAHKPKPGASATSARRFDFLPSVSFEAPKLDADLVFKPGSVAAPVVSAEPEPKVESAKDEPAFESMPKVDPEAHKPEPVAEVTPKPDPEAHKIPPAPATPSAEISRPVTPRQTREFHLTNGERVAGVVLSDTPEAVYVEHATLGVLTIPRAEIATRLVEIILINGDRIVGNIMAETPDMLYVRHASLGMLSVPRAQRSTRVVEAILEGGDRILGEVLTETDSFTVIKSATLGTVTVPHNKVTMLNRKIEQIELKRLLPSAPQLSDKPAA